MEKSEIEELKQRVSCAVVLETAGFTVDVKESTRRAVKHRRGDAIVIVIHDGRGWFDPLSDAKGDVFTLVMHLEGIGFSDATIWVGALIGFVPSEPAWTRRARSAQPEASIPDRWRGRRAPWRGSQAWVYLTHERHLPETIVGVAIRQGLLREGPKGSMWAAHTDETGAVTGWEERGPEWRGFATGGAKRLFGLGDPGSSRFCVTEAAIDAMSLAALEGPREKSLYLSTGGGWSPATDAAVRTLAAQPGAELIAATDANAQGEAYAFRLREIAEEAGCGWQRLKPSAEDWNQVLEEKVREARERRGGRLPQARDPRQG